jgi:hypothetical protein
MISFALTENAAPQLFRAEVVSIDNTAIRVRMDTSFADRRTDLEVELVDRSDSPIFAEPAHAIVAIPEARVARITTIDSLGNGVLIGAGAGAAPTLLACTQGCAGPYAVAGGVTGALIGAGLGALIDAARPREGRTL